MRSFPRKHQSWPFKRERWIEHISLEKKLISSDEYQIIHELSYIFFHRISIQPFDPRSAHTYRHQPHLWMAISSFRYFSGGKFAGLFRHSRRSHLYVACSEHEWIIKRSSDMNKTWVKWHWNDSALSPGAKKYIWKGRFLKPK